MSGNNLPENFDPKNYKKYLKELFENMQRKQSILGGFANFWGRQNVWTKILSGMIVFGVLLLVGILMVSDWIIVATCVGAFFYAVTSMILDNHFQTQLMQANQLETGVLNLGELLLSVITELKQDCAELKSTTHDLQTINEDLKATKLDLEENFCKISEAYEIENEEFKLSNKVLTDLNNHLMNSINSLTKNKNDFVTVREELQSEVTKLASERGTFSVLIAKFGSVLQQATDLVEKKSKKTQSIETQTELSGSGYSVFHNKIGPSENKAHLQHPPRNQ